MRLVAGVDGGGTGTRALILDEEGTERGRGEGPPGIVLGTNLEAAADRVADAIETAVAEALATVPVAGSRDEKAGSGVAAASPAPPLAHLCAGLAGAGSEESRLAVRAALEGRSLARAVTIRTDVAVALRDAFAVGEAGILLVSGTGSVAVGRGSDGEVVRVGGWGALLDDAGSGYRIGLDALRGVVRALDGRAAPTELTTHVLTHLDVTDPESLVVAADRATKARIAALAPGVLAIGREGDGMAREIMDRAVGDLVELVKAVAERLAIRSPDTEASASPDLPVALHGGLVGRDGPLRLPLRTALGARGFEVLDREVVGTRGAASMAIDAEISRGP